MVKDPNLGKKNVLKLLDDNTQMHDYPDPKMHFFVRKISTLIDISSKCLVNISRLSLTPQIFNEDV